MVAVPERSMVTPCSNNVSPFLSPAPSFVFKGRKSEAEEYFVKAIQLDPAKGNCYMHYGRFLIGRALHVSHECSSRRVVRGLTGATAKCPLYKEGN